VELWFFKHTRIKSQDYQKIAYPRSIWDSYFPLLFNWPTKLGRYPDN